MLFTNNVKNLKGDEFVKKLISLKQCLDWKNHRKIDKMSHNSKNLNNMVIDLIFVKIEKKLKT